MTLLPTGETLPDYDDGPADGVDMMKLAEWLMANRKERGWSVYPVDTDTVRDVLAALQAVGDATLVKNDTYRLMRRDGADIERLAAWMSNNGMALLVVEQGGNPAAAAVAALTAAQKLVKVVSTNFGKLLRPLGIGD